jgi:hypothetical protein
MNATPPARLDLAQAGRMVEAALDAAQISADERERRACAKTLLRLEPPTDAPVPPGNFADTLLDLGRDGGRG